MAVAIKQNLFGDASLNDVSLDTHNFAETPFPRFQRVIFCLACSL